MRVARHGAEPIVIADAFGVLVTGRWERGDDGALRAVLAPRARRIAWRAVTRGQVTYRFPQQLGHAVVASRALHVVPGGDTEGLVTHEATHVLAYEAWGAAGTPLLGEGLAVWMTGSYAGTPLAEYRGSFTEPPAIAELLGPAFRKLPEPTSYPLAGIFVEVAVRAVGLDNVRAHLVGASPATWEAACRAAGTTPAALETAFAAALTAVAAASQMPMSSKQGSKCAAKYASSWASTSAGSGRVVTSSRIIAR